jgi:hypothetical protein
MDAEVNLAGWARKKAWEEQAAAALHLNCCMRV